MIPHKKINEYLYKITQLEKKILSIQNVIIECNKEIELSFDLKEPVNELLVKKMEAAGKDFNDAITDLRYYKMLIENNIGNSHNLN